jgi:hypothetical protein
MSRIVATSTVVVGIIFGCYECNGGIVAQWKFNETGGNIAHASVGPWDGLLTGGAAFAAGAGIEGGAIQLDRSTDSLVNMGHILPFTESDFSIQAWVKSLPKDPSDLFAVSRHQSGYLNGYILFVNGINPVERQESKAGFYHSSSGPAVFFSETAVNDGSWHQLVGVYHRNGQAEIYVDGGPLENQYVSWPIGENDASLLIGGLEYGGIPTGEFTGMIDDVQIYDHALHESEVNYLFNHAGQAVPEPQAVVLTLVGAIVIGIALKFRRNRIGIRQIRKSRSWLAWAESAR